MANRGDFGIRAPGQSLAVKEQVARPNSGRWNTLPEYPDQLSSSR